MNQNIQNTIVNLNSNKTNLGCDPKQPTRSGFCTHPGAGDLGCWRSVKQQNTHPIGLLGIYCMSVWLLQPDLSICPPPTQLGCSGKYRAWRKVSLGGALERRAPVPPIRTLVAFRGAAHHRCGWSIWRHRWWRSFCIRIVLRVTNGSIGIRWAAYQMLVCESTVIVGYRTSMVDAPV